MRVRFAPSPTGYLHVGGARTALFNWLYARRHGGTFVLRIEDTDAERSSDEMVQAILTSLRWMGVDWDEGPEVGGPHGPYTQTARFDRHREQADALVRDGHAYYCYCTTDRLQAERAAAESRGEGWIYDRQCLRLGADEIAAMEAANLPRAVRVRVPEGETTFDDQVHGPITVDHATIEDFVIVRSDGLPTYQLSVVCDDIDMAITHVIRGDDHISNTPKQIILYRALDAAVPAVRARAAHPRPRQEAPQQAARRHRGWRVRSAGHPARGVRELSGAARLVAGQRRGDLHPRGSRRALLARRHQRRQRRLQPREARLVQRAAPGAARRRRPGRAHPAGAGIGRPLGRLTDRCATGVVRPGARAAGAASEAARATSRRNSCRFLERWTATTRRPSTST